MHNFGFQDRRPYLSHAQLSCGKGGPFVFDVEQFLHNLKHESGHKFG